jgi:proteasome accessory factor B
VWVAEGRAYGLRRLGRVVGPRRYAGRPGEEIELELRSMETVARWLAGHGADIAVLDPPSLSDRVRANWEAAAAAHADAAPAASA